ncbi:MAG TPA: pyridoxal phosphate-dependent aminotransferase family protein [Verrucomicrobiae bacterium]|nr:pyridoxal phosphate-dependent aminotransferase family protein [Verrucomicrobiae bacterium]
MIMPAELQQADRTSVRFRERKLISFSGCDYFRLASHPSVLTAAGNAIGEIGLNVAASRRTTGDHRVYRQLESELADFFHAPNARLVATGYAAPQVVAQAWAGRFSHVLIDERAHVALQDASRFFDCPILRFRHRDPDALAQALKRIGPTMRPVVLTDGLFAFDGTIAPLRRYRSLLPRDSWIVVDDAHGAGVLGATGKGSLEAERVPRTAIVQCVTLSKAFGVYGGAVIGSKELCSQILQASALFAGSTPMPLPLAQAARVAIRLLRAPALRRRLQQNVASVKQPLRQAGFDIPDTPAPIIPVVVSKRNQAASLKRGLLAAGIYPPFLKYPGAPPEGYFRFVLSSEHSQAQLQTLVQTLTRWNANRRRSNKPGSSLRA